MGARWSGTRSGLRCAGVELRGEVSEQLIRINLLAFGRLQQTGDVFESELVRPCFQRAVSRDLVMFDRLRGRCQTGVAGAGFAKLRCDFVAFTNDAFDGLAWRSLCERPII